MNYIVDMAEYQYSFVVCVLFLAFSCSGCEIEEYAVMTKDGYILLLHRLFIKPSHFSDDLNDESSKKPVVLLMHGCMMNSEVWLCQQDPKKCYPILLFELG
jgi:lysosomal acid lipase/cholesteryl ester hydrolase